MIVFPAIGGTRHVTPKLLVAEDDIFVREMIAEFLRDAGFDVVEAGNADEAMAVFEAGVEIDLLFSDVRMPGSMDGSVLAERVRGKWPATHIVLTSGYSSALLETQAKTRDPVVPKPYRPLSVLAAILSAVEP
jgi:two-component system, response regulator PdtaR